MSFVYYVLVLLFGAATLTFLNIHRHSYKIYALPLAIICGALTTLLVLLRANTYMLLLILAFLMIYGLMEQKTKNVAWGRPLAAFSGIVAVVMALWMMFYDAMGCEATAQRQAWEAHLTEVRQARGTVIGEHLREHFPDSTAVVIHYAGANFTHIELDAMKEATDHSVIFLERIGIGNEDLMEMQLAYEFTQEELLEILQEHEPDLLISYVSLPYDIEMQDPMQNMWNRAFPERIEDVTLQQQIVPLELPKFILIGGSRSLEREFVERGVVPLIVSHRPGFQPGTEIPELPSTAEAIFTERFLKVTPENIDAILKKHPTFLE